ncbi:uncharacterized protein LOC128335362 isoform X2 [Hemicordylus capensis]|uniref:uncharacterized protein LOC128335362 isoform X2 n=1 Tax=Hemicordylus capensis TaxID=884348 RepID=UPI002302DC7A|nr:uncharacterized protein LOC128335362 isoform X2 [Hemicordylus capensis]
MRRARGCGREEKKAEAPATPTCSWCPPRAQRRACAEEALGRTSTRGEKPRPQAAAACGRPPPPPAEAPRKIHGVPPAAPPPGELGCSWHSLVPPSGDEFRERNIPIEKCYLLQRIEMHADCFSELKIWGCQVLKRCPSREESWAQMHPRGDQWLSGIAFKYLSQPKPSEMKRDKKEGSHDQGQGGPTRGSLGPLARGQA